MEAISEQGPERSEGIDQKLIPILIKSKAVTNFIFLKIARRSMQMA